MNNADWLKDVKQIEGPQLGPGVSKEWKVEVIEDSDDALITCPVCEGGAVINLPSWVLGTIKRQNKYTRSCTYCFRTSAIPEEIRSANSE
jgi:hypothetical protein